MAISFPGGTLGKTGTNGDGRMKESKERSKGKKRLEKRRRGEEMRTDGRSVPDVRSRPQAGGAIVSVASEMGGLYRDAVGCVKGFERRYRFKKKRWDG